LECSEDMDVDVGARVVGGEDELAEYNLQEYDEEAETPGARRFYASACMTYWFPISAWSVQQYQGADVLPE
jgi:hypothetical protein